MIGGINVSLVAIEDRYGLTFSNFRGVEPFKTNLTFSTPDEAITMAKQLIKQYYTPGSIHSR